MIETVPELSDGVIVSDGVTPLLLDPHPDNHAPEIKTAAANNERMKTPREANEIAMPRSHAHGSRAARAP
jgi:hypothetical protein